MDTVEIAWGISVITTAWFLPIGMIRIIAYSSGQADHDPGMRNLALVVLGTGLISAVTMVALTIVVLSG